MIITLVKADFSAKNIGTLSSFAILTNILHATYEGPTSVATGEAFYATITMHSGYTFPSSGMTISMGGTVLSNAYSVSDNVISISIAAVTGVVVINMAGEAIIIVPDLVDITSLFNFNLAKAGYIDSGATKSSVYFDACDPVDISSYSGTHLSITFPNFTPTSGGQSGFGCAFFDGSGTLLSFTPFPSYTTPGPIGTYLNSLIEIPEGATTFATSIFNSDAVANGVYGGAVNDFSCAIMDITRETDITSMFNFNATGQGWRVVEGNGAVTAAATNYWNSATVDMSEYAGRYIKIAAPIFRTSSNTQGPYGYAYEDASGNNYVLHRFNLLNDGNEGLGGEMGEITLFLPQDIKNFLVCYYSDAMLTCTNPITDEVRNGFYCKILS